MSACCWLLHAAQQQSGVRAKWVVTRAVMICSSPNSIISWDLGADLIRYCNFFFKHIWSRFCCLFLFGTVFLFCFLNSSSISAWFWYYRDTWYSLKWRFRYLKIVNIHNISGNLFLSHPYWVLTLNLNNHKPVGNPPLCVCTVGVCVLICEAFRYTS